MKRLFRRVTTKQSPPASAGGDCPPSLEGEYRDVTVLFADLEGFTTISEQLPASEVVALLNDCFTLMAQAVDDYSGRVDKFIGDAMLVVWAGDDPEMEAERAVRAALRIQEAIAAQQEEWLMAGRRPIKVRLGISSGRAILAQVGSPSRREHTVIGDVVNTASRLENLNKEFHTDIILSGSTLALAGAGCVVRDLGKIAIKGRREPVQVFSLLGWNG